MLLLLLLLLLMACPRCSWPLLGAALSWWKTLGGGGGSCLHWGCQPLARSGNTKPTPPRLFPRGYTSRPFPARSPRPLARHRAGPEEGVIMHVIIARASVHGQEPQRPHMSIAWSVRKSLRWRRLLGAERVRCWFQKATML
jgi:hypothetical protein